MDLGLDPVSGRCEPVPEVCKVLPVALRQQLWDVFQPDIVVLCAPNNPTGTPLGLETIEAAYEATDGILLVDEAYAEFMPSGHASALLLLPGRPRSVWLAGPAGVEHPPGQGPGGVADLRTAEDLVRPR